MGVGPLENSENRSQPVIGNVEGVDLVVEQPWTESEKPDESRHGQNANQSRTLPQREG